MSDVQVHVACVGPSEQDLSRGLAQTCPSPQLGSLGWFPALGESHVTTSAFAAGPRGLGSLASASPDGNLSDAALACVRGPALPIPEDVCRSPSSPQWPHLSSRAPFVRGCPRGWAGPSLVS